MDRYVLISLHSIPSRDLTGSEGRCEFHFRRSCHTVLEMALPFLHHPSNILEHSTSSITMPALDIVSNVIVIVVIIIIVLAVLVGVKSISLWL